MDILYYREPKSNGGGVGSVAHYLPTAIAKKIDVNCFATPKSITSALNLFNSYGKFAMKKFDIIHFNVIPQWFDGSRIALKLAKRLGTRSVLNIHGILQLDSKYAPTLPLRSIDLLNAMDACNSVDKIVVNSEYMRYNLPIWYGVNRDKIFVIPNGVNQKRFYECNDKVPLEGDPAILFFGSLTLIKGIDVLIKAIAKLKPELPRIKLHLVGPGFVDYFQLLVKENNIENSVVFHGWSPDDMVPRYLKSADICVFPSKYEPFGIVILEAMASGAPIIASDIGGIREIISSGKNGILFKSEDADSLSKQILSLYLDVELRKKISHNAMITAEKYSWEKIADKYISFYNHLCE
jgi:glycosyltransferase involved in cell wall biosynthesis